MKKQESFSKQIDNFVFIFYTKAWTIPNMAIRHIHNGFPRKSYALDVNRKCTKIGRAQSKGEEDSCNAVCTETMIKEAVHSMLGRTKYVPAILMETVTFKGKLKKLSPEWYIRKYTNVYTKGETRYIFYHDCLGKAHLNTFYKGTFDFLLPYLDIEFGCQVCGTKIPNGVLMAVRLQKANMKL